MDSGVKKHIISIMKGGTGGCRHQEMRQALRCKTCGDKMVRAQSEYNRLYKTRPELFKRQEPEYKDRISENKADMLADRIKTDKLYINHLKLLQYGTPEEKKREMARMNRNYYKRHTGENRVKIII